MQQVFPSEKKKKVKSYLHFHLFLIWFHLLLGLVRRLRLLDHVINWIVNSIQIYYILGSAEYMELLVSILSAINLFGICFISIMRPRSVSLFSSIFLHDVHVSDKYMLSM